MMFTKHLISGMAAAAIVTTVGLAYAQTTTTPQATTPGSTASSPATDGAMGTQTTPSPDSTMNGSTPAPQADRN